MSKICKYCWEPIPDGAEECKNCGKKVSDMLEHSHLTQKKIKLSDKEEKTVSTAPEEESDAAKMSAKFKRLEYSNSSYSQNQESVKISYPIIVIGVILILACVGFGAYKYYNKNNNSSLDQMLNIMALQEKLNDSSSQGFDPNSKFRYSDNPYFRDQNKNPGSQDLFDKRANDMDFGGGREFGGW